MRTVGLALVCVLLVACTSDNPAAPGGGGGGGGGGDGDNGAVTADGGSGGGSLTGSEDDPIICIGNPDEQVVCGRQSEFWDCDAMPGGDVKCTQTQPQVPSGDGSWDCEVAGDKLVCKTSTPDAEVDGGGGWTCVSDDVSTTCTKDAPVPPGGGTYDCSYGDGEFNLECVGSAPPPPPTEPSPTGPTGAGTYICYDVEPGTTGLPLPPEGYWAKLIGERVLFNGVEALHIRLTLSKAFVDNTYGQWSVGYKNPAGMGTGHSFGDLEESDKAEIFVPDSKGNLLFHIALDYISKVPGTPSGYGTLGVSGEEGQMILGDAADVLAAQTSLAVNFNGYGYVLTKDSPQTDLNYTPDPQYPNWIFDVWYEAWIKWSAFGEGGPGKVYITGLHASPNKAGLRELAVVPVPCP